MKSEIASKESGYFHISVNKTICGGRPIVKGTRIAVADIAGYYLMGIPLQPFLLLRILRQRMLTFS